MITRHNSLTEIQSCDGVYRDHVHSCADVMHGNAGSCPPPPPPPPLLAELLFLLHTGNGHLGRGVVDQGGADTGHMLGGMLGMYGRVILSDGCNSWVVIHLELTNPIQPSNPRCSGMWFMDRKPVWALPYLAIGVQHRKRQV